jgi:hypothetical protein
VTGSDPELAERITGKNILVLGGASALWDAEVPGADVAVTVLGRPPRGGKDRVDYDKLRAELEKTRDPARVAAIQKELGRLAIPASRLPRNDKPDAAANRPNVTLRAGDIEGIERLPEGGVKVTIDGRAEVYDQVVSNLGFDPGPMMRSVLGEGAKEGGEVPAGSIALELREYEAARDEAGKLLEPIPFELVGTDPSGARVQLAGAAINDKIAPWVKKEQRERFLELFRLSAREGFVSEHSVGVGGGLEASRHRSTRANEGRGMDEYRLPGPGLMLHLTEAPAAWQGRVRRFVTEELKLDPARVEILERGGGKTKDRVFEIRVGGRVHGIFKVFRDQRAAATERQVLEGLEKLSFEKLAPVKERGDMAVDQGPEKAGGALLMEKADGPTLEERLESVRELRGPERAGQVEKLTADFVTAARALAELHARTTGGGLMTRAEKEADVRYVLEKLPDRIDDADVVRALDQAIRNHVAPKLYDAEVPATAYHGDAHVGNFTVAKRDDEQGEGGKIGMFDVGSMKWSVELEGEAIPKTPDGTPILEGKKTGANDVGRMLQSIESMGQGALRQTEIDKLAAVYLKAYEVAYNDKTSGVKVTETSVQAAMTLYQVETELAALENDPTALDRIWILAGGKPAGGKP